MISIILVNYNGAKDTIECINSINHSIGTVYRIIVVDNNSSSDDKDLLINNKDALHYILILSQYNGGFSYGNNIGIKEALRLGTDYVLLLNNDTIIEKKCLSKLIIPFEYYKDCGLSIGKIKYESKRDTIWYDGGSFDYRIAKTKHFNYKKIDNENNSSIIPVTFATGCCMCIKKEVIDQIGLLDEKYFLYEEDLDYCIRLMNSKYKMYYIPEAIVYHKVNASTKSISSLSQFYQIRNHLYIIKRYVSNYKIFAYLYFYMQCMKKILKKQYDIKIFKSAIKAFKQGKTGKHE